MMLNNLSRNILTTAVYYDIMDYPMTVFEIWKYLISYNAERRTQNTEKTSLAEVIKEMEKEEIKKYISEYRGFYFLRGRKELVDKRIKNNKISEKKLKKAQRIAFWLKFLPFIKMIAIAGRVASKNAQKKSDIDFFIIIKHGYIFTGRFLITALVHIFGKRRYGKKITDRICLNHFISDKYFISIRDLYSSHAYKFLIPIYKANILEKFKQNNDWMKKYRPNTNNTSINLKEIEESRFSIWIKKSLEKILSRSGIEKNMKKIQINKIKKNSATYHKGGTIIYSDCELAFWPDFENQGPAFFNRFYNKLEELNNKEILTN